MNVHALPLGMIAVLCLLVLLSPAADLTGDNYSIGPVHLNAGGGFAASRNGVYTLVGSIGSDSAGAAASLDGTYEASGGFLPAALPPRPGDADLDGDVDLDDFAILKKGFAVGTTWEEGDFDSDGDVDLDDFVILKTNFDTSSAP